MYIIRNDSRDPYFNMAAEEYFLDSFSGEVIILWRNDKTVVVGRNQNSIEEVDPDFVRENNVTVVRRLTGGGAVFHDRGNINFTVIENYRDGLFSNYEYFTRPISEFLGSLGVEAQLSGRNDLLIDGMKFSGNAQTKRGGRIMHHGTLMFSADTSKMAGALKPSPLKIESKSIKSVRSRVTNILPHLKTPMTADEFLDRLYAFFAERAEEYTMTTEDIGRINELSRNKYSTWEWNYGASPKYTVKNARKFPFGIVDVRLSTVSGLVEEVKIYGDFFGARDISRLESLIQGSRHEYDALSRRLEGVKVSDYISGMEMSDFLTMLI